ncbi:MAG TPA: M23 family metallopeptidase [Kofleriaceae bacterium]
MSTASDVALIGVGGVGLYFLGRERGWWSQPATTDEPKNASAPQTVVVTVPVPMVVPGAATPLPGRWICPLPTYGGRGGRAPVISNPYKLPAHHGTDLMYARVASDAAHPELRAGGPNGTANFVIPEGARAIAAADGVLWSAAQTPRGWTVVLDHSKTARIATYYTHLSTLLVPHLSRANPPASPIEIRAGQPLGLVGADPMDREHVRHLHFEIWSPDHDHPLDPGEYLKGWEVVADTDVTPFGVPPQIRNASSRSTQYSEHVREYWRAAPPRTTAEREFMKSKPKPRRRK